MLQRVSHVLNDSAFEKHKVSQLEEIRAVTETIEIVFVAEARDAVSPGQSSLGMTMCAENICSCCLLGISCTVFFCGSLCLAHCNVSAR